MAVEVGIHVNKRFLTISLKQASLSELKEEFAKLCEIDEVLRGKLESFVPTFSSQHPKFKRLSEIKDPLYKLEDGQEVFVDFIPRIEVSMQCVYFGKRTTSRVADSYISAKALP